MAYNTEGMQMMSQSSVSVDFGFNLRLERQGFSLE